MTAPDHITEKMVERAARAYVRAVQETFEDAEPIDFQSADWKEFEDQTWPEQAGPIGEALKAALS